MDKKENAKDIKMPQVFTKNQAVFIILGLVIGFLIGYVVSSAGGGASSGVVGQKVESYITDNFLAPQGAEAQLDSIESQYGLYQINFDILKDGEVVQQAQAYATKDGKYMIVGQVFDMNENLDAGEEVQQQAQQMPKSDKPNIKFFVMSYCPFGQQAENGLGPALAELEGKVDWEPHFVIYSNYGGGGPDYCFDDDSKYCSMHGIKELNEGVRQLCIFNDKPGKWWDYVSKINERCSLSNIDTCWKDIAKEVGFDVDKIEKCVQEQGLDLLADEAELNERYGVRGSPTVFINDAEYNGGRAPGDYLAGICSAFNNEPSGCSTQLESTTSAATGGCG
jgi:hypothetical protein